MWVFHLVCSKIANWKQSFLCFARNLEKIRTFCRCDDIRSCCSSHRRREKFPKQLLLRFSRFQGESGLGLEVASSFPPALPRPRLTASLAFLLFRTCFRPSPNCTPRRAPGSGNGGQVLPKQPPSSGASSQLGGLIVVQPCMLFFPARKVHESLHV